MQPSAFRKDRGIVITLSGPSGVGKGTVIGKVLEICPAMRHSVSVTTRPPRPGETDGVQYYFTDPGTFRDKLARGEILEHDIYCGNYYGTPKAPLIECIENGADIILDITVPGSLAVMENFPEAVSVFLLPPSFAELRRRLLGRGTESVDVQKKRLEKAVSEMSMASRFEYVLINDDLQRTAEAILAIAEAEKHRYARLRGIEDELVRL